MYLSAFAVASSARRFDYFKNRIFDSFFILSSALKTLKMLIKTKMSYSFYVTIFNNIQVFLFTWENGAFPKRFTPMTLLLKPYAKILRLASVDESRKRVSSNESGLIGISLVREKPLDFERLTRVNCT